MRINRFLARSGIASRRKSEDIIRSGMVYVNGSRITELATEINPDKDTVEVGGEIVELPQFKYYALNKPAGYTCTKEDKHAEHTIFELLPQDSSLFTVGRLDRETTGLILITNDGNFAQNIIHPTNKIRKTYLVKLQSPSTKSQIEKLTKEIQLEDGVARAIEANIVSEYEIELIIEEGRKRIVRRMIKAVGNNVVGLERTQIGDIHLDTKEGEFRELSLKEIEQYV
mgnify:CR=1 FL=1